MIRGLALSLLLLIIILAFYAMDFYFMLRHDRQRRAGKGWAWDYTLLTLGMGLAVILQPVLLPQIGWNSGGRLGLAVQAAGLVCAAFSFGLHIWARRHLGKFYAERVEVQPDHQLIQTGPYAYMRHPVITSFFALAIGIFLLAPALTTALILVYTFWDFGRAARQEEELLSQQVPGYREYMRRTPRFLPCLWRKRD